MIPGRSFALGREPDNSWTPMHQLDHRRLAGVKGFPVKNRHMATITDDSSRERGDGDVAVGPLFVVPAAFAGSQIVLGLGRISGAHGLWQPIFAGIGPQPPPVLRSRCHAW